MEASGRTLGQTGSEGFDRSSNVVYELRAATDQCLPGADDGHVGLALFAPVLERMEQLGVHSCQASQVPGVDLIGLLLVGIDELQLAGVGHQHLMTALLEHPANPGRVGARLDRYAQMLL